MTERKNIFITLYRIDSTDENYKYLRDAMSKGAYDDIFSFVCEYIDNSLSYRKSDISTQKLGPSDSLINEDKNYCVTYNNVSGTFNLVFKTTNF